MKDLTADIWPKFLQLVGQAVVQNQKGKRCGISRGRPVRRYMVDIRDRGSNGITNRFGIIKSVLPGIRSSNKKAIYPVVRSVNKTPFPQLVVARIFVQ